VIDSARLLFATTPGARRLLRNPEHPGWPAALEAAGEAGLEPLREVLEWAAADALEDRATLETRLRGLGAAAHPSVLFRAGVLSEEIAESSPHAAFVLSWLALTAWALGAAERGEVLDDTDGIFDLRWCVLPHACASAAMRLGGLHGAMHLTARAHETMRVARYRGFGRRDVRAVEEALARYDALARRLAAKSEIAVRDLADELRDACEEFRAEVAALLWTIGRVPESRAVMRRGAAVVTRPLAQRLVRESMRTIPHDPLLQYVWLEMKDRPGLELREHDALFAVINHRWSQWWLDESPPPLGESPSRCYAQTLIKALGGRLDEESGHTYLALYDTLEGMGGGTGVPAGWGVPFRLRALRMLVGARLDLFADDSREAMIEYLEGQVEVLAGNRVQSWQHPELPRIGSRLAAPAFELVERRLAGDPGAEDLSAALELLERPRLGGLRYWLRIAPPLPPRDAPDNVGALLESEEALIEDLRGASFLTMKPTLPPQFAWADLDAGLKLALEERGAREAFYSPDVAREEIDQLERELDDLARRIDDLHGGYTHAPQPVTVDQLVDLLSAHANQQRPLTPPSRSARGRS